MGFDKIVDGEEILAIKQPCTAPNDLFEFNHEIDRPHQDNVSNITRINTGGKFLRCGQYSWYGFFVVLKIPKILITQYTIIGGNPLAIIRIFAVSHLVDQVSNNQCMKLGGEEYNRYYV